MNITARRQTVGGSVLVFSLLILSILLVTSLTILSSALLDRKASLSTSGSTRSFQVADSGVEEVLFQIYKGSNTTLEDLGDAIAGGNAIRCTLLGGTIPQVKFPSAGGDVTVSFYENETTPYTGGCSGDDWRDKVVKIKSEGSAGSNARAVEVAVAASNARSGYIFTWGENSDGQLGLGDAPADHHTPTQVGADSSWNIVSNSAIWALAVKNNGTLWSWGSNVGGRLGLGTAGGYIDTPQQIGSDSDWKFAHSSGSGAAIKMNGDLYTWGPNNFGQLGLGDTSQRNAPTLLGSGWRTVAVGGTYMAGIKTDGFLYTWGENDSGQLGLGFVGGFADSPQKVNAFAADTVRTIVAGQRNLFVIKTDGTLWSWGRNDEGQLGLGDTSGRNSPTRVGTDNDWKSIGAYDLTVAIKTGGTLWAWGDNYAGGLGLGDVLERHNPVQVDADTDWEWAEAGTGFAVAIKNGRLYTWGSNNSGQLGLNDTVERHTPTQVGSSNRWKQIEAGGPFAVGVWK